MRFRACPKGIRPSSSKPINLDKELEEQVQPDRAASYYHYSLAKWIDEKGNVPKALSEMQIALKYESNSSIIHLEIAQLLEKSGDITEAIEHAKKAAEIDPKDPDPHGFLPTFTSDRRCGEALRQRDSKKRYRNWKS